MAVTLSVVQGGAVANEAALHAEPLVGLEKFIASQAKHFGFVSQDISELHAAVANSEALQKLEPKQLKDAILSAFHHVQGKNTHVGAIDLGRHKRVVLDDILNAAQIVEKSVPVAPRPEVMAQLRKQMAEREPSTIKPHAKPSPFSVMSTGDKLNIGMWGIGAVLGVFGVYSAAKYSVLKDEDGKNHVQWSQVGVALLQACLTASCAYMGAQAYRGAVAAR